jgi:GNAT superfamily N-acetyltransferase
VTGPVGAPGSVGIRTVGTVGPEELSGLCDVLLDCVDGGASVGFLAPLHRGRAEAFWRRVAAGVAAGNRLLLVAEDGDGIVGTVQLVLDLAENQPHRADVTKVLVHRRARRRGVGANLMEAVELAAARLGRSVLVLDTVTGSDADRLYSRLGWQRVGDVPGFALHPDGRPCSTTYFYRHLPGTTDGPTGLLPLAGDHRPD